MIPESFDSDKASNQNGQPPGNENTINNVPEYFTLPYFGQIDNKSLEGYYSSSATINENEIIIDLDFNDSFTEREKMEIVKDILENIENLDVQNKVLFDDNYNKKESEVVKEYLKHHLEEFSNDEIKALIGVNDVSPEKQLLKKLHLIRLAITPDNEQYLATFDYSIGIDLTQYLIVIRRHKNGELDYLGIES